MNSASLLIELGTEELPPKLLSHLSQQFKSGIEKALKQWKLEFGEIQSFASPRRLAVLVTNVPVTQANTTQKRKGPALKAAFNESGEPTPAALGFAKSCGVSVNDLEQMEQQGHTFLCYEQTLAGQSLEALLQDYLVKWLDSLQAPRKMRWGEGEASFIRPIHWICALHGYTPLKLSWHNIKASSLTYGHRFHHPAPLSLSQADDYEKALYEAKVIANQATRHAEVESQIQAAAKKAGATAVIPTDLLDEVTNLVEWPNALLGEFDTNLLKVPPSALITAMQHHQKCFALLGPNNVLMPYFVMVSNIAPHDPQSIIKGNERVINARLNDAKFFFDIDQKTLLDDFNTKLRTVIFQKQLGSIYDKVIRITKLCKKLIPITHADEKAVEKAAEICKADLMTEMVGEFPELQGIMGHAYALLEGYPKDIAIALEEIYLPRYAGDRLPESNIGLTLSLADRLDTLVGIFSIGGAATGDKDPFALRRVAIGILRLLIEKSLSVDIYELLNNARENYSKEIESDVLPDILSFLQERLKSLLHDQGYDLKVIDAVMSTNPSDPYDTCLRIQAVKRFMEHPEAESLSAANKRVRNILTKADSGLLYSPDPVDMTLLKEPEEKVLAEALITINEHITPLLEEYNYAEALSQLAALKTPIDQFFEKVMVMAKEDNIRQNRILLLNHLHQSFKQIADISRL